MALYIFTWKTTPVIHHHQCQLSKPRPHSRLLIRALWVVYYIKIQVKTALCMFPAFCRGCLLVILSYFYRLIRGVPRLLLNAPKIHPSTLRKSPIGTPDAVHQHAGEHKHDQLHGTGAQCDPAEQSTVIRQTIAGRQWTTGWKGARQIARADNVLGATARRQRLAPVARSVQAAALELKHAPDN